MLRPAYRLVRVPQTQSLTTLRTAHAPAGHTAKNPFIVNGKPYTGGEFIPDAEVSRMRPEQARQIEWRGEDPSWTAAREARRAERDRRRAEPLTEPTDHLGIPDGYDFLGQDPNGNPVFGRDGRYYIRGFNPGSGREVAKTDVESPNGYRRIVRQAAAVAEQRARRERVEQERQAAAQAERERLAAEKAERERLAAVPVWQTRDDQFRRERPMREKRERAAQAEREEAEARDRQYRALLAERRAAEDAAKKAERERRLAEAQRRRKEKGKKDIIIGGKKMGESKAKVKIDDDVDDEGTHQIVRELFDFGDSPEETEAAYAKLASVAGAPDDAEVTVTGVNNPGSWRLKARGVTVKVEHPKIHSCERFIGIDEDGTKVIHNEILTLEKGERRNGFGTDFLARQVENAAQEGFEALETHAAGRPGEMRNGVRWNGYSTWPKLGYDQSLTDAEGVQHQDDETQETFQKARDEFPAAKSVLDIIESPGGREWWEENGCDIYNARFDLAEGSRSMRVLDRYLKAKAAQNG